MLVLQEVVTMMLIANAQLLPKEVQDWEKQWDEDEDDDSDEDDVVAGRQGAHAPAAGTAAAPPIHAIRPGMDTGHSDGAGASPSVSTPPPGGKAPDGKPYFVTPDAVYDAPASPTRTQPMLQSAPNSPNVIPLSDDEGIEWDTGFEDSKPNVQMFLPMLRVLGKGSFGKVRYFCVTFV